MQPMPSQPAPLIPQPPALPSTTPFPQAQAPASSLIQPISWPTEEVVLGENVVPKDVAVAALQGKYINLGKFAMSPAINQDQETLTMRNDKLSLVSKLIPRNISSFEDWLLAWTNYEELLCRYLPQSSNIQAKSASYRRFIQKQVDSYQWQAVYTFDTKYRVGLSSTHSFDFDKIDLTLFVSTLTPLSLRSDLKKCFRCSAIDHKASACPFRTGSKMEKNEKKERPEARPEEQICFNFNKGKCTWQKCRRKHVCERCRGPKPSSACDCKEGGSA